MSSRAVAVKQLLRPLLLVAPLAILVVVPAVVYGRQSQSGADAADRALVSSVVVSAEGRLSFAPDRYCGRADTTALTVDFAELGLGEEDHMSTLSGVGFNTAVVDLTGHVTSPPTSLSGDRSETDSDRRDDISVQMHRVDAVWCIDAVAVSVSD